MNFSSPYVDLPQRLTVRENLTVYAKLYGVKQPRERIKLVSKEFRLEDLLDQRVRKLSSGQKTRVSLAKSMINRPEFLLLDEPTNHLDMLSVGILVKALQQYEGTFMVVSHDRHFTIFWR